MQYHATTTLHELFGDLVILRDLAPFDPRLPGLADAWREMGLDSPRTPRNLSCVSTGSDSASPIRQVPA